MRLLSLLALFGVTYAQQAPTRAKIGIIGGGISGIRAATVFEENGERDWLLLEADGRMGGRLREAKLGGDTTIEFGANWVEGTHRNPIFELANACGVKYVLQNFEDVHAYDEHGRHVPDEQLRWEAMQEAYHCVETDVSDMMKNGTLKTDMDVRAALTMCGWEARTPMDWVVEWFSEDFQWAERPDQTSANFTHPDRAFQDFAVEHALVVDPRGYVEVAKCLADQKLKQGGREDRRFLLNKVVEELELVTEADGVERVKVYVSDGSVYVFDHLVLTLSVGVLRHRYDQLFGRMADRVPLHQKAALFKFRMPVYQKVFMKFPYKFWDDEEIIVKASDMAPGRWPMFQNLDHPRFFPGSGILFATSVGQHARGFEQHSVEDTKTQVMNILRQMYGEHIPEPLDFRYPKWGEDPLAYGSFTNWPAGFTEADHKAFTKNIGPVFVAGEAACFRMGGTVHGGYGAGELAAKRILKERMGHASIDPSANYCVRPVASYKGGALRGANNGQGSSDDVRARQKRVRTKRGYGSVQRSKGEKVVVM